VGRRVERSRAVRIQPYLEVVGAPFCQSLVNQFQGLLEVVCFDCIPYWSILTIPDFVHGKRDLGVYFIGPELLQGRELESLLGCQPGKLKKIHHIVAVEEGEAQTLAVGKVYCNSKRG
jgi:hypothetical protein